MPNSKQMKPSQRIFEIKMGNADVFGLDDVGLDEVQDWLHDHEEKIKAIMDYLDEEYEKRGTRGGKQ